MSILILLATIWTSHAYAGGSKLLASGESRTDSLISSRVLHQGAPLIAGRRVENLTVAIRNTSTAGPRQGVPIVLRGVHWTGEPDDTRQWLTQLRGRTQGSFTDFISYNGTTGGVTDLAFETGLILPGDEIIVTAPLTPRQIGQHELIVRYAVIGNDGKDWSAEVLVPAEQPRYFGGWFRPATPERVRERSSRGHGIVRSTSKPGAPPLPIQQTIVPLTFPVAPAEDRR